MKATQRKSGNSPSRKNHPHHFPTFLMKFDVLMCGDFDEDEDENEDFRTFRSGESTVNK